MDKREVSLSQPSAVFYQLAESGRCVNCGFPLNEKKQEDCCWFGEWRPDFLRWQAASKVAALRDMERQRDAIIAACQPFLQNKCEQYKESVNQLLLRRAIEWLAASPPVEGGRGKMRLSNFDCRIGLCLGCGHRLTFCGKPFSADIKCATCGYINIFTDSQRPVGIRIGGK